MIFISAIIFLLGIDVVAGKTKPELALDKIKSDLGANSQSNPCQIISNAYNGKYGDEMVKWTDIEAICRPSEENKATTGTKSRNAAPTENQNGVDPCVFLFGNEASSDDISIMFFKATSRNTCSCSRAMACFSQGEMKAKQFVQCIAKIAVNQNDDFKERIASVCRSWSKVVEFCKQDAPIFEVGSHNLKGCQRLQLRK